MGLRERERDTHKSIIKNVYSRHVIVMMTWTNGFEDYRLVTMNTVAWDLP